MLTHPQKAGNALSWKDANISAIGSNAGVSERHKKRSREFKLLGHAQKLMIENNITSPRSSNPHRTRLCHAVRAYGQDFVTLEINQDENNSEARISSVQTCGCVWTCPVCVSRIMVEKGEMVRKALAWADSSGLIPVMVTLTASHNAHTELAYSRDSFKSAYRLFTNRRKWKNFKKLFGVQHHIANVEVTHGVNGWHYHKHMLLFLEKSVLSQANPYEKIQEMLSKDWLDCLYKNDLSGLDGIALKVSTHANIGEHYLSKMGLSTVAGDLAYEITGQANKESRSVFDLLRHSYYGDELSSALYLQFAREMTGENFITCSHGLPDLLDAFEMPVQESKVRNAQDTFEEFMVIPSRYWYVVKKAKIYHEVMDVAASSREPKKVLELIRHRARELHDAGIWIPPDDMKREIVWDWTERLI
jgi:hypothetical protein